MRASACTVAPAPTCNPTCWTPTTLHDPTAPAKIWLLWPVHQQHTEQQPACHFGGLWPRQRWWWNCRQPHSTSQQPHLWHHTGYLPPTITSARMAPYYPNGVEQPPCITCPWSLAYHNTHIDSTTTTAIINMPTTHCNSRNNWTTTLILIYNAHCWTIHAQIPRTLPTLHLTQWWQVWYRHSTTRPSNLPPVTLRARQHCHQFPLPCHQPGIQQSAQLHHSHKTQ